MFPQISKKHTDDVSIDNSLRRMHFGKSLQNVVKFPPPLKNPKMGTRSNEKK